MAYSAVSSVILGFQPHDQCPIFICVEGLFRVCFLRLQFSASFGENVSSTRIYLVMYIILRLG